MAVMNYLGPVNSTGIGHHSTAIALSLCRYYGAEVHPFYADFAWRPKYPELFVNSIFNPLIPTFIFDTLSITGKRNSGSKRILMGPFETTSPIDSPELVFHKADFVGTFSKWGIEQLKEYLPEEKLFMIPYAFYLGKKGLYVNVDKDTALGNIPKYHESSGYDRLKDSLPVQGTVFSTVGKVEVRKCFDLFINELPRLQRAHTLLFFGIGTGAGPNLQAAINLCRSKGFTANMKDGFWTTNKNGCRIIFMPKYPTADEMWSVCRRADYYLSPTRGEGWGIPTFEALAQGMRVISSPAGAHSEFISEDTACTIPVGNLISAVDKIAGYRYPGQNPKYFAVEEFINTIQRALSLDREHWVEKQRAGVSLVASYTWKDVADRLNEIISHRKLSPKFRVWKYDLDR